MTDQLKKLGRKPLDPASKRKTITITVSPQSFIAIHSKMEGEGLRSPGRALDMLLKRLEYLEREFAQRILGG